jgi:F-type H+-transporting ATPase subunit delta
MSEQRVSGRYAKSLVDLALERKALDAVYADMVLLKQTIEANSSLANMLKSPIIKTDKKQAIVKQVFSNYLSELSITFINLVAAKNRSYYLYDIAIQFIVQYNEINRITTAHVKTAVAISAEVQAEVKRFLEAQTGKRVELKNSVDQELIGGMVIQIEDRLYDASISGKLRKAKQELLNTYISK